MGDDEDGPAVVAQAPQRPNPVTQDEMDAGSVDVIVTSPPYNLGIRYRTYDDTMPRRE